MEKAPKRIKVSPEDELALLIKAAIASGEPIIVDTGEAEYPLHVGSQKKPRRRLVHGKPTSEEDPLWNIVGIARSGGPTDVARNKHKYLAEAYAAKHA